VDIAAKDVKNRIILDGDEVALYIGNLVLIENNSISSVKILSINQLVLSTSGLEL
jgi:hypothetical protein